MKIQHEFLTIGDFHLEKLATHFPASHLGLQFSEIEKACDYAVKNGIEHVIDLGDISDQPHLGEEARVALLEHYLKYDGKFERHVILGNHDVRDKNTHSLMTFEQLIKRGKFKSLYIHKDPVQTSFNDITINYLPFPATNAISSKYESVNFAHLSRPGTIADNGYCDKKNGVPCTDNNIWVIGHLHTKQTQKRNWWPGTIYQTNFGEKLPKGFSVFKVTREGKKLFCTETFFKNDPAFKLIVIKVENEEDLDKLTNNPLYRYKLKIKNKSVIPLNLNQRFPNIVGNLPVSTVKQKNVESKKEDIVLSPLVSIMKLAKKEGFKKSKRRQLKKIVQSFLERV